MPSFLIKKNVKTDTKSQTPGLGNVPVIGNLFKGKSNKDELSPIPCPPKIKNIKQNQKKTKITFINVNLLHHLNIGKLK